LSATKKPFTLQALSLISSKFCIMSKISSVILLFLVLGKSIYSQDKKAAAEIRQYWFVMLTKGNNRNQDSVTADKIQQGHMANITRLYNEGKLKVAGPFGDDGNWKGIFIFDCSSKEEVEKLLVTDPAIQSGRLAYEIHPWWTAASGSFLPGKPPSQQ
jgi:uncharacterized protein